MILNQIPAAPTLNPQAYPGLTLWLDASKPLYQLANGTSLATTDGQSVQNAPDYSGLGNTMVGASVNLVKLRIVNGIRTISFDVANAYLTAPVTSGTLSAFSLHLVIAMKAMPANNVLVFSWGINTTNSPMFAATWTAGSSEASGICTPQPALSFAALADIDFHVISVVFTGSQAFAYFDGAMIDTGTAIVANLGVPAAPFTRTGYCLAYYDNGAANGVWKTPEVLHYEAAQTTDQVLAIQRYLRNRWAALFDVTNHPVIWISNSLASQYIASYNSTVPYLTRIASAKISRWIPACPPGQNTVEMIAGFPYCYPAWAATPSPSVAVIWEGTNDIYTNGATGAQAYAHLVTLANLCTAAGYTKIVMGTILPRGSTTTGTFETARQAANALILADSTNWNAVADLGGNVTIGAPGAQLNMTYYNNDYTHLINAGCAVAATVFQPVIDSVLP